jgi:hypothetical protein
MKQSEMSYNFQIELARAAGPIIKRYINSGFTPEQLLSQALTTTTLVVALTPAKRTWSRKAKVKGGYKAKNA